MKNLITAAAISSLCFAHCALSADYQDLDKFYAGAGFSHNRIDLSSVGSRDGKANGFQVFGGYDYDQRNGIDIAFEAGFIQSGEFFDGSSEDADGIWGAAVIKKDLPEIKDKLSGIARLGYGLGGDDGLLMGFGAQYQLNPKAFLRLEYVNKDLTQSYQVNAVYHF
ncbi:hypothetical protein NBRC116188_08040 [Oceaniserpentilla sp. 4NH20-0058]|uniref:outer membrane beta-barrel protein n=1 Tax=Oceaniserpentilla sp. 4NH20-0058 TaxID=3127660 RepID=UPI00310C3665